MLGSTPMVPQSIPSTNATYSAQYNTQYDTMGWIPVYQNQDRLPMCSSNRQIQTSRVVPNMHMLARNDTVPPTFSGMHGQ